jgi:GAF domain-containing protein
MHSAAILDRRMVDFPDVRDAADEFAAGSRNFLATGYRAVTIMPMLRGADAIGALSVVRRSPGPLSDKQLAILRTFASQAVIAIENTRLLDELQTRMRELAESLERQTATSEILRVISTSPADLQPVFDTIALNAAGLCAAKFCHVFRFDGELLHFAGHYRFEPEGIEAVKRHFPAAPDRGTTAGRSILSGDVEQIADVENDPDYTAFDTLGMHRTYRSLVAVPMLREGSAIGTIVVARAQTGHFPRQQVELLETFADQAVIAIENTRLLDELRTRMGELNEALERQTASADVLRVIASEPGDAERVLQTIVETAQRLFDGSSAAVTRIENGTFRDAVAAGLGASALRTLLAGRTVDASTVTGKAVVKRRTVQVDDITAALEEYPNAAGITGVIKSRTICATPLLRESEAIGTITVMRDQVRPLTPEQVELLETFADQAVIAIENARLLAELQARGEALAASVEEQKSLAAVSQVVNSSLDLQTVLATILSHACVFADSGGGSIYVYDETSRTFSLDATHGMDDGLRSALRTFRVPLGDTAIGQCAAERRPVQIADVETEPDVAMRGELLAAGIRALLSLPLLRGEEIIGALVVRRRTPGEFPPSMVELLRTLADQSALAIHNARLFNVVETRTRELTASLSDLRAAQDRLVQTEKLASLGQLTAGIAHEIKNPLNFVNNFSSLSIELIDELGAALKGLRVSPQKRANIGELADLLRGNLDKVVQHGRRADAIVKNMLLHSRTGQSDHRPADINAIVEESLNLAYHGARAERQGFNITLEKSLDPAAGEVDLFPLEITRVLLNLISNGFHATTRRLEEAGGAEYRPTLTASTRNLGDKVEIRIRDNGTGISDQVKEKMFNPFFTTKPAGEGTGLGLSLSHDIVVKQHAGSIEVETEPGEFTEFRVVLPRAAASLAKPGATT